jgi:hypothetical protein
MLSVSLPISPESPGRDADPAGEERAGPGEVSLASASRSFETRDGSQDPRPRCLPSRGCAIRERPYAAGRCGLAGVPGGGPAGGAGRKGESGYFWYKVRTAPRFPQPGGWVLSLEGGTPCSPGSPYGEAPWRRSGGPAASPNSLSLAQAAELGRDLEPHPRKGAAGGRPRRRCERWGTTVSAP